MQLGAGLIDLLFKGHNLLIQLLCHTNRLLTSACKQSTISYVSACIILYTYWGQLSQWASQKGISAYIRGRDLLSKNKGSVRNGIPASSQ